MDSLSGKFGDESSWAELREADATGKGGWFVGYGN